MAKCVKDGLCFGFKCAYGVSIPRGEPVLGNLTGVSYRPDHGQLDEFDKVVIPIKRADFTISSCGITFLIDSTSGIAIPEGCSAKSTRSRGFHARFIEARKRLEYTDWRFGSPNEFVPFAMDNSGMLSDASLRFLRRMKLHAKRLKRFNGATRFWEALSIGLAKGSAHGFGLMARGIGE